MRVQGFANKNLEHLTCTISLNKSELRISRLPGGSIVYRFFFFFCGNLVTTGGKVIAYSELNDTSGLHCYRFILHRHLTPLEVLLMIGMVVADDRNYGVFKYVRIKKVTVVFTIRPSKYSDCNKSVCH